MGHSFACRACTNSVESPPQFRSPRRNRKKQLRVSTLLGLGDEIGQILPRSPPDPEDPASRKIETGNLKLNTMPCWPKLVSTTTLETTLSWAQPAESTSESAHFRSPTPEIQTSSAPCQPAREVKDSNC